MTIREVVFLSCACQKNPAEHLGGDVLAEMLGQMDASALEAEIVDITPARWEKDTQTGLANGTEAPNLSIVPVSCSQPTPSFELTNCHCPSPSV